MTCENYAQRVVHLCHQLLRWTGSYLRKPYCDTNARKYLRLISKRVLRTGFDWVGADVWISPVVALAPPVFRLT